MTRPWLAHYPKDIPSVVDTACFSSLADLFKDAVARHGSAIALESLGHTLTFLELDERSTALAAYFSCTLGLKSGDRIALMLPNCMQAVIAMIAAFKAGLVVVNVNPLYTVRELVHQMNDAKPKAIIVLANVANTLADALPQIHIEHIIISELGDAFPVHKAWLVNAVLKYIKRMVPHFCIRSTIKFRQALARGRKQRAAFKLAKLNQNSLAFLQYTGGTTGVAKGAMLSHGNLVANVIQAYTWIHSTISGQGDVAITPLPLYHVFSLVASCWVYLHAGVHNVLVTNPRDLPKLVDLFKTHRVKALMGVNTLFNALANNEDFAKLDHSSLKLVIAGGMALQAPVAKRWHAVTGNHIIEGYGLTETSPIVSIGLLDGQGFTGSIGLPVPCTDVAIFNDTGETLPAGEVGELCVKGPQVMQGYWQQEAETANVFWSNGWLRTGDMAKLDENGFIYIVDRKKDMITVAGFNVYPNEVEAVIASHPKVLEVGVVGVPNRITGESVMAYVVAADKSLTKTELNAFCRDNLVSYKVPRRFKFMDELPKSNVGKILRRELKS